MKELADSIAQLRSTIPTLQGMLGSVGEDEWNWHPKPEAWSILDVVNHLADEERVDFRVRLDLTLHQPEKDWPGIDPEGAVKNDLYQNRSLQEALDDFVAERERSLQWLETLNKPDWSSTHTHPLFGSMQAGTLMASWVGHDLLHLRQIARLRWDFLAQQVAPFSLRYAGDW
ncbi:MAG: DinB family protein [Ignavibacteriae bacterium]|nr:DinB family protein [Ignavibacteriota bacterium]MCB9217461.1 DinB family protein [Ignavibacteria bacterium]